MKKKSLFLLALLPYFVHATNYISVVSGGSWSSSSTWSPSGIPGSGDNVTINTNVTIGAYEQATNVTINSGYTLTLNNSLQYSGTLTNNGSIAGSGSMGPIGNSIILSGTGRYNSWSGIFYLQGTRMSSNATIIDGIKITFDTYDTHANMVFTNNGFLTLTSSGLVTNNNTYTYTFINGTGATVITPALLKEYSNDTLYFTATNNTVAYGGGYMIDKPKSSEFYNLRVNSIQFSYTTTVLNNLQVESGGTLNMNGHNVIIGGNLYDSGSITNNTGTFTFNGTANQIIGGNTSITFKNLTINCSDTVFTTLAETVSNTLTISNGILDCLRHQLTNSSTPAVSLSPSSAMICYGSSTTVTASSYTNYLWYPSAGLSATIGSSVTASPTATTTYSVYGISGSKYTCGAGTDAVTVTTLPTLTVTPLSASVCIGSSTILTVSGANTYVWSQVPGVGFSTSAAISVNPTSTTTYTVTGTNSTTGCTGTQTVVVTVNPLPTVSVMAKHDTICAGILDSLKANGASTYTWSPSISLSTTTGSKVAVVNLSTTTTYTVTGTDVNGCVNTATQIIVVNHLPIVNADTDLVHYITGASLDATGGTAPYTYLWSPIPANPLLLPDTVTTYTLTVTDANGCTSRDTTTFIPVASPTVTCGSLFISEYIQDSSSGDDAIEIYNPTTSTVNLNSYYLIDATTDSGFGLPYLIKLHGTVAAHKTFVVVYKYATDTVLTHKANMFSDSLDFDGREMVALARFVPSSSSLHFTMLDKVGDLLIPSNTNGWPVGSGTTQGYVLVRKGSTTMGDLNWTNCQNEWNVFPKDTFTYLHHYSNACTPGDPDISFSFANQSIICYTSPSTYSFDVMVTGNPTSQLNNCTVDVQYSSAAFYGDNVSNGTISVTQGSNFTYVPGDNDYNNFNVVNLLGDTVVEVTLGDSTQTSIRGTILSSSPQVLFHVTLQITDCHSGTINFVNGDVNSMSYTDSTISGYSLTNPHNCDGYICNPHLCNPYCCGTLDSLGNCSQYCYDTCYDTCYHTCYDTVYNYSYSNKIYTAANFSGDFATATCPIIISDFTSPIPAGTDSVLIISGNSFGAIRQGGQVEFKDADSAHTYAKRMNDVDYLSWNNNQIKIRLPGFVDSTLNPITYPSAVGGSRFIVQNSCGDTLSSNLDYYGDQFTVPFNIDEEWNSLTGEKQRVLLRKIDSNGGYIFHLNPADFPIGSYQRGIFIKAVKEWVCYTGANLVIGDDTTLVDTGQKMGINYVFYTNNPSLVSATTIANTLRRWQTCNSLSQTIFTEGDICFNSSAFWIYDTTNTFFIGTGQADFYGVCLHEIGHFLGLGHTTDPRSLMYWIANTGPIGPGFRITLATTYGAGAVDGGIYIVGQSSKASAYYCNGDSAMNPEYTSCVNPDAVNTLNGKSNIFTIYPNPSLGSFMIATNENDYTVSIINMLGQDIFSKKVMRGNTEIDISTEPSGMYFVELISRRGITTKKLIIQK
jgi:hypothetical protein